MLVRLLGALEVEIEGEPVALPPGKPRSLMQYVVDRPAHDRRYALSSDKLTHETGWQPHVSWEEGVARTIRRAGREQLVVR